MVSNLCFDSLQSMSVCGPEWDGCGGILHTIIPAHDHLPLVEGKRGIWST
jgi:hypothetical protein